MKKINLYMFEYTINYILRYKSKNIFVTTVFTLLISLLASIFFIASSLRSEEFTTLNELPEIIIQNQKAGMHTTISEDMIDSLLDINGISGAKGRVWGYYYFDNAKVNFSIVGIDEFESQESKTLQNIVANSELNSSSILVGKGVRELLQKSYYSEYFNFIKPNLELKKLYIAGSFNAATEFESNDMIVMSKENAKDIFGYGDNEVTDIAITIINPDEIAQIAIKIKDMYPNINVITKEDLKVSYQNLFDYKSGLFMALFTISLFTFFMIIYDKSSGLSSEEKKEIGILKAIGWRVEDVLYIKLYEGMIISFFSYFVGIIIALIYVYILQAPLLNKIFLGYSNLKPSFDLIFVVDYEVLLLLILLTVPLYIAATIIPSWKVATTDADEVMR
ncbi:ABC transporter permease [Sulfurimonas sp.]